MKYKLFSGFLIGLVVFVCLGATVDDRLDDETKPIARYEFAQLSWAAGVSAATTTTLSNINLLVERIDVLFPTTTDNVTVTFTLTDQNGVVVATFTTLEDNITNMYLATQTSTTAADFRAFPLCRDTLTLSASLTAAAPGASLATLDVILRGP